MGKHQREGEYVCLHCRSIYEVYGDRLECDLCGRKLQWRDKEQVEILDAKWTPPVGKEDQSDTGV